MNPLKGSFLVQTSHRQIVWDCIYSFPGIHYHTSSWINFLTIPTHRFVNTIPKWELSRCLWPREQLASSYLGWQRSVVPWSSRLSLSQWPSGRGTRAAGCHQPVWWLFSLSSSLINLPYQNLEPRMWRTAGCLCSHKCSFQAERFPPLY